MLVLFTVPSGYFAVATFVTTGVMVAVAFTVGGLRPSSKLKSTGILLGLGSAAVLYLIFYLGGAAINAFHPFGMTSGSEASIYSLISSPSNPLSLQVALLIFDSAGYESLFRGVIQRMLQPKLRVGAVPIVAIVDAGLHIATLNPVWVGATFVTDLVWGLTYYYGKGTQASFASHLAWDLAIFIVRPVT